MRVKRPYHLYTETLSAFYETIEEATASYNHWTEFYQNNIGKYGTHTISVTKGKKTLMTVTIEG